MKKLNVISVDLAKNVFQVCGLSEQHSISFNKKLKRQELLPFISAQPRTVIVMEACYSSHYWARQFQALGHTAKLLPAQHVSPFVRGNKSDHNDAIAIAEASRRPNITPVPVKSEAQQDIQCLHRIRERHVAHRTGLMNQTRGLLSEYGIIAPQGHKAFCTLLREIAEPNNKSISPLLKTYMRTIADEYCWHTDQIDNVTQCLSEIAHNNALCQRLLSIPGIGVINATAIYSAIGNGSQFKNAREFAVWLGLTPRQASSGDSFKSSGITKHGNRYLRKQLVHGARSVVSRARNKTDRLSCWANQLVARRGVAKTYVAMAARLARIAWIVLNRQEHYKAA